MVFVEFFDKTSVENICVSLIKLPSKIYLVGPDKNILEEHRKKYISMFSDRGQNVDIEICVAFRNNINAIIERLTEIVNGNDELYFDLTGGEELYLVAAGIVYSRFPEKNIQLHRYSIKDSRIIDCDGDGEKIIAEGLPFLSVKENIELYGGVLRHTEADMSCAALGAEDKEDIREMWRICSEDPKNWNEQSGVFAYLTANSYEDENSLVIRSSPSVLSRARKPQPDRKLLRVLAESGLIRYEYDSFSFKVTFKNELVRSCLDKSGKILEMMIYMLASESVDDKGDAAYCDVVSGAFIDWDGVVTSDRPNTENEIDVMLMRGVMPIFISCKNGAVIPEEVYKLNTVAEKFGKGYAKKVLIASSASNLSIGALVRCNDMGIKVIDDVDKLSIDALRKKIDNLWK